MTNSQIRLVQISWRLVLAQPDEAALAFYQNLFELKPEFQSLFHVNTTEQGHKLIRMMGVAVAGLRRFHLVGPAFETLARKHLQFQVSEEMYGPMGEALQATLRQILGVGYTAEIETAWREMYRNLAHLMTAAAYHGDERRPIAE
jgi:hemoglobin-like flavoprotein